MLRRLFRPRFSLLTTAAGAVVAWLFDPEQGAGRRAKLKDRTAAVFRRGRFRADQKARYLQGKVQGFQYRLTPRSGDGDGEPVTGPTLADKVRSEVLGQEPFRGYDVDVDVVEDEVTLRGEIEHPDVIRALREAVERLPEVAHVESLLHPPGTPAPNVLDSLRA